MATRPSRGFTLLEMMIVLAIVGVITAMAVATYSGIGRRAAPQNAAYDFSSALSQARSRAAERNANVWVVIFPGAGRSGAAGNGAWVMYEDYSLTFGLASNTTPESIVDSGNSRVLERKFLDDYAGKNAKFGVGQSGTAAYQATIGAPFPSTATPNACNFCSDSGAAARGAIVFSPDGNARFVKADDTLAGNKIGIVSIVDSTAKERSFSFGISRATAYVGLAAN